METGMSGVKTVVTKVEPRSTPDSDFEIPGGYTRTRSPFEGAGLPERFKGQGGKKVRTRGEK